MLAWCPPESYFVPYGESVDDAKARLRTVAEDIVTVAMDVNEPPLFAGDTGRVKTALLDAGVASLENAFQRFVDEGRCNSRGYVADRRGNCDGGHAYSYWSIHVYGGGYILLDDGTLSSATAAPQLAKDHPEFVIGGQQLISDRQTAVRVAQRVMRQSLKAFGSLCAYSGEPCTGTHAKASIRLERAQAYWRQHPFVGTIPEPTPVSSKYVASNASSPNTPN
jgi:hypothetical protein